MIENILKVLRCCASADGSPGVVLVPSISSLLIDGAVAGGTIVILMDSMVSLTCGVDVETIVMTQKTIVTELEARFKMEGMFA